MSKKIANMARERPVKTAGERVMVTVSFAGRLGRDERLAGTPVVTEIGTSDLEITDVAKNTVVVDDAPVGKAVRFMAGGGGDNSPYRVRVTCTTTSVPPQTLEGVIELGVEQTG